MSEWLPWIGGILTAVAAVLASYAVIKQRQNEGKSIGKDELQQALDAQNGLMDRYEKRIERLEARIEVTEKKAEDAIAARDEMNLKHRSCESRLALAEARIAELGG